MGPKKPVPVWLVVAGCVVVVAWYATRDQVPDRQAVARLRRLGARVTFADPATRRWANVNFNGTAVTDDDLGLLHDVHHVCKLSLAGTAVTDQGLARLAGLDHLEKLTLRAVRITDAGLDHLRRLPSLRTLVLDQTPITDAGLERLRDLPRLVALDLSNTKVGNAGLARLAGLSRLTSLTLSNTRVTDEGLSVLRDFPGLEVLNLSCTQVSDAGLPWLQAAPALRSLNLGATRVMDAGLAHLAKLTRLRKLTLSGLQITDAGARQLRPLTSLDALTLSSTRIGDPALEALKDLDLSKLDVSYTGVTDAGLESLRCFGLRELRVSGSPMCFPADTPNLEQMISLTEQACRSPVITDRGAEALKRFPRLRVLHLGGAQVTDAGLAHLAALTGLEELDLGNTAVTDAGLGHLAGLTRLEELHLAGTGISSAGLEHLRGLGRLQILTLSQTEVGDAGLGHLAGLPYLHDLALSHTDVGDAGLERLAAMDNLEELNLAGTRVTDAGLVHLAGLFKLRELNLSEDRVTARGLEPLQKLPGLEEVSAYLTGIGEETARQFLDGENPIHLWVDGRNPFAPPPPAAPAGKDGDDEPEPPAGRKVDGYGDPLPPGARARLGTLRFWQPGSVSQLALSPDGKVLASLGGGQVSLWEAATGRRLRAFKASRFRVGVAAFSPDGRWLAAADYGRVRLWEVATGKPGKEFPGAWASVTSLAFAPDGKALALAGYPARVRVLDVATGRELLGLRGREQRGGALYGGDLFAFVAFAPDGKTLAAGGPSTTSRLARLKVAGRERLVRLSSQAGRVHLWEFPSGKPRVRLEDPAKNLTGLAFAPDGRTLVTAGDGALRVWEAATGKPVRRMEWAGGRAGYGHCLAVGPDGRAYLTTGGVVRRWDLQTGRPVEVGRVPAVCLALSRDGQTLATADHHGILAVRDAATGRERVPLGQHRGQYIYQLACSPDGRTVAMAGEGGAAVRLWEAATGREIRSLDLGGLAVGHLGFSPDGRRLAAAVWGQTRAGAGRVQVWDVDAGKKVLEAAAGDWKGATASHPVLGHKVLAVAKEKYTLRDDGRLGGVTSAVLVLDPATGKVLRELDGHGQPVHALALSPDERRLAWGGEGRVWVAGAEDGKEVRALALGGSGANGLVLAVAFSPDGKFLAAGVRGGAVAVWDWATGKQVSRFQYPGEAASLALHFVPDGRLLAAADAGSPAKNREGSEVRVWDVAAGKLVAGPFRIGAPLAALAFTADGKGLAAGYYNPTALIWEVGGGN